MPKQPRPRKPRTRKREPSPQTRLRREEMRRRGYITPAEAAAASRTPLQTIYTWVREGRLAHTRIGAARVFVSVAHLREMTGPLVRPASS